MNDILKKNLYRDLIAFSTDYNAADVDIAYFIFYLLLIWFNSFFQYLKNLLMHHTNQL